MRLQRLQNRAMRVILKVNKYTSVKSMLEALMFMSVKQRIYYDSLILIFKIKNNLMPDYLKNEISFVSQHHNHNVRSKNNFRINFMKKSKSQRTIFFNGLNLFNKLPNDLKNEINLNRFKTLLVKYV